VLSGHRAHLLLGFLPDLDSLYLFLHNGRAPYRSPFERSVIVYQKSRLIFRIALYDPGFAKVRLE
jgi:hypothetical protein